MHKKILFEAIVLILIFGSIWGLFTLFPVIPDFPAFDLSVEKEARLGDLLTKNILRNPEFFPVQNDTLESAMDSLVHRLISSQDSSVYQYKVIVFENNMANAFALPGGNILISTGLIGITGAPEEIAAVLAHEMGHVEKRHTLSRLLKNFTAALLFSNDVLVAEAAETLLSTAFDRKQEEEADRYGLKMLEAAQINPICMGTVFRHLKDESGAFNPNIEILMSHPDIDSRIREAYGYNVQSGFVARDLQINWDAVKRQLNLPKSQ